MRLANRRETPAGLTFDPEQVPAINYQQKGGWTGKLVQIAAAHMARASAKAIRLARLRLIRDISRRIRTAIDAMQRAKYPLRVHYSTARTCCSVTAIQREQRKGKLGVLEFSKGKTWTQETSGK